MVWCQCQPIVFYTVKESKRRKEKLESTIKKIYDHNESYGACENVIKCSMAMGRNKQRNQANSES